MTQQSKKSAKGFTLIELVAVITIIVMLGAIAVGGMGYLDQKRSKEQAKVTIELLAQAIENYKLEMGEYPGLDEDTDVEGKVSDELYDALFYEGYLYSVDDPAWTQGMASKIYLAELDPRNGKQTLVNSTTGDVPDSGLKIRDPWGREYRYRKGDDAQNPDFDLWSVGKDGNTDASNPSRDGDNADDIRNF